MALGLIAKGISRLANTNQNPSSPALYFRGRGALSPADSRRRSGVGSQPISTISSSGHWHARLTAAAGKGLLAVHIEPRVGRGVRNGVCCVLALPGSLSLIRQPSLFSFP